MTLLETLRRCHGDLTPLQRRLSERRATVCTVCMLKLRAVARRSTMF